MNDELGKSYKPKGGQPIISLKFQETLQTQMVTF